MVNFFETKIESVGASSLASVANVLVLNRFTPYGKGDYTRIEESFIYPEQQLFSWISDVDNPVVKEILEDIALFFIWPIKFGMAACLSACVMPVFALLCSPFIIIAALVTSVIGQFDQFFLGMVDLMLIPPFFLLLAAASPIISLCVAGTRCYASITESDEPTSNLLSP